MCPFLCIDLHKIGNDADRIRRRSSFPPPHTFYNGYRILTQFINTLWYDKTFLRHQQIWIYVSEMGNYPKGK
jgi:hypothetical protein